MFKSCSIFRFSSWKITSFASSVFCCSNFALKLAKICFCPSQNVWGISSGN
ncbi:secreted protein [Candidatus Thiomargarita nelsonii]|uniref:Secreted protein n=1 Tax=Candidatus Thiomargarita nelsonii TaxID=1003181 RepID=A0A176S2Y4_9GAMM|nr:secreted protein [Candidatus Thiomargarita nelsonii]